MSNFMPDFSQKDYDLIINALEYKRGHYIPGDKVYNEYGEIIEKEKSKCCCLEGINEPLYLSCMFFASRYNIHRYETCGVDDSSKL